MVLALQLTYGHKLEVFFPHRLKLSTVQKHENCAEGQALFNIAIPSIMLENIILDPEYKLKLRPEI